MKDYIELHRNNEFIEQHKRMIIIKKDQILMAYPDFEADTTILETKDRGIIKVVESYAEIKTLLEED